MAWLVAPITVDSLVLGRDTIISGANADFSLLPYRSGDTAVGDQNADSPYLSSSIGAKPFADGGMTLKSGVHLHWALPDVLTRARAGDHVDLPTAPDRWFVRRNAVGPISAASWIVESDFLHPPGSDSGRAAVSYPVVGIGPGSGPSAQLTGAADVPWRGLGRVLRSEYWTAPDATSPDYLNAVRPNGHRLTAFGWGDPAFAAFYPNCHSVFGFCDATDIGANDVVYDVVGWHARAGDDMLDPGSTRLADALSAYVAKHNLSKDALADPHAIWADALKEGFRWRCAAGDYATRTLYVGRITVSAAVCGSQMQSPDPVSFALGHTGSEALAALLGHDLGSQFSGDGEDAIEAVQLDERLASLTADRYFKFREARHDKGFAPTPGGLVWTIVAPDQKPPASLAGAVVQKTPSFAAPSPPAPRVPGAVIDQLLDLNQAQETFDRANEQTNALRQRLYSDWHRYQMAAYPPPDEWRDYPDPEALFVSMREGVAAAVAEADVRLSELAGSVRRRRAGVEAALAALRPAADYRLKSKAAPRFWRPVDPVLLIGGPVAKATKRRGRPATLDCPIVIADDLFVAIDAAVSAATVAAASPAWNPFLFEWEAAVEPFKDANHNAVAAYDPDFIARNFSTNRDNSESVDLAPRIAAPEFGEAVTIAGRSMLSGHATRTLAHRVAQWIVRHADPASLPTREQLRAFAAAEGGPDRWGVEAALSAVATLSAVQIEWTAIAGWLSSGSNAAASAPWPEPKPQPALDAAIQAEFSAFLTLLGLVNDNDLHAQTQALTGFHDALLGLEHSFRLPIADPMAPAERRGLAPLVADLVGRSGALAPMPDGAYNPIRSGRMRITALRLIDTFGQTRDIARESEGAPIEVLAAQSFRSDLAGANRHWLAPRYCQPARLDFHWLAARSNMPIAEANEVVNPVCGWLLPNTLDHTIQVHDADGSVLGLLERSAPLSHALQWRPRPGASKPIGANTIPDAGLRRLVAWLLARDAGFLENFIAALVDASATINPVEAKSHDSLASLFGRPFAVVRASVGVSLHGLPAANHGWDALDKDVRRAGLAIDLLNDVLLPPDEDIAALEAAAMRSGSASRQATYDSADRCRRRLSAAAPVLREIAGLANSHGIEAEIEALAADVELLRTAPVSAGLVARLKGARAEMAALAARARDGLLRTTDDFERVRAPVRIGEWRQLNDGLAGYWTESAEGVLSDMFFASQVTNSADPAIRTHADKPHAVTVAPADASPLVMTMLIDPTGVVHATSGLLPTRTLRLPPQCFASALAGMQIFFEARPLLTPQGAVVAPLRRTPGYTWTFLYRDAFGQWMQTSQVKPPSSHAEFTPQHMIEGWLRLDPQV